jgi:hypothetical protein
VVNKSNIIKIGIDTTVLHEYQQHQNVNELRKIKDCFKQHCEKKSTDEILIESEKECTHQRKIRIAENKGMED